MQKICEHIISHISYIHIKVDNILTLSCNPTLLLRYLPCFCLRFFSFLMFSRRLCACESSIFLHVSRNDEITPFPESLLTLLFLSEVLLSKLSLLLFVFSSSSKTAFLTPSIQLLMDLVTSFNLVEICYDPTQIRFDQDHSGRSIVAKTLPRREYHWYPLQLVDHNTILLPHTVLI